MTDITDLALLTAQAADEIPINRAGLDGKLFAGDIAALACPVFSAVGNGVSVTQTETQVAAVTFTAKAGRSYIISGSVHLTKDTGTTARAVTLRLRRGIDNSGTLIATGGGASAGLANSPFGASLVARHVPGAGSGTYRLSVQVSATATVVATQANLSVVELA
jgi:hypothetical protein